MAFAPTRRERRVNHRVRLPTPPGKALHFFKPHCVPSTPLFPANDSRKPAHENDDNTEMLSLSVLKIHFLFEISDVRCSRRTFFLVLPAPSPSLTIVSTTTTTRIFLFLSLPCLLFHEKFVVVVVVTPGANLLLMPPSLLLPTAGQDAAWKHPRIV